MHNSTNTYDKIMFDGSLKSVRSEDHEYTLFKHHVTFFQNVYKRERNNPLKNQWFQA